MAKKKLLMISLQENEAKDVAQVISNKNCRTILDYLGEKEATETEISENLKLPLSTVHYNLQQLIKARLVEVEHFHYSKRGKEINHYKLANQYIIIAPKKTYGIKEKLRSILPAGIITIAGAGLIQLYSRYFSSTEVIPMAQPIARQVSEEAEIVVMDAIAYSADAVQAQPNYALWFLIGGIAAIFSYLAIEIIKVKIKNRRTSK